ncbi:hypothetical protein RRG08_034568 [Elysia crispata]|uniref:Uncharacterized protein n=1 Tax=Elysia crispata TaxID=231223 RepID=A0AAE1B1R5_9GAST|nr:hypothetical protein RRG08_034568 [Elysia crispata]
MVVARDQWSTCAGRECESCLIDSLLDQAFSELYACDARPQDLSLRLPSSSHPATGRCSARSATDLLLHRKLSVSTFDAGLTSVFLKPEPHKALVQCREKSCERYPEESSFVDIPSSLLLIWFSKGVCFKRKILLSTDWFGPRFATASTYLQTVVSRDLSQTCYECKVSGPFTVC